jgi:acyl dehydratase
MPHETIGPLTRTDFVRYAGAGGDFNPLHHDETVARAAGLPTVFGMGMLHAGMLGTRLARWAGPANVRRYSVRFIGQVWPGDVLTFSGRVRAVVATADGPVAELELAVTRQTGDRILEGRAVVVVAPAPDG